MEQGADTQLHISAPGALSDAIGELLVPECCEGMDGEQQASVKL